MNVNNKRKTVRKKSKKTIKDFIEKHMYYNKKTTLVFILLVFIFTFIYTCFDELFIKTFFNNEHIYFISIIFITAGVYLIFYITGIIGFIIYREKK